MDLHNATSDVNTPGGTIPTPPYAGLTPCVLPEADAMTVESSQTGVSTDNVPSGKKNGKTETAPKKVPHWYVLRTTYGRERKAYNYLMTQGVEVFYPTVKRVKMIDGRRTTVEESRIPNLFFAFGTEEELRFYVYDNVNLPYLRFYYRKTHVGNRVVSEPLYVPKRQMDTLKIICAVEASDVVTVPGELKKFPTPSWASGHKPSTAYPASIAGARFRKMQNIGLLEAKVRMFGIESTEVYLKEARCFCFPKKGIPGAVKYPITIV